MKKGIRAVNIIFYTIAIFAILGIVGTVIYPQLPEAEENITKTAEPGTQCNISADCAVAGCSAELCLPKDEAAETATICLWKEEYECLRYTRCICNNGYCEFEQRPAYLECLEEKRK